MPRVSVRTAANATMQSPPEWITGGSALATYFDGDNHPLHLHRLALGDGRRVTVDAGPVDRVVYVQDGSIETGSRLLGAGSSVIVERDARLEVTARGQHASILLFSAACAKAEPRAGGHVHLLPWEFAPRSESLGGVPGLGGVLHADADCPTCEVWLHENRFSGREATRSDAEAGVHSHSEDEIIFVISGDIRLGARLYGAGTAVAIAADTLYSFTPGPRGLGFINFRAGLPGDIRFANGKTMSETAYWRDRLPRPRYLSLTAEGDR